MDEGQQPTTLRIGGYVGPPVERTGTPDDKPRGVGLPNISDYWPDAPDRTGKDAPWQTFLPVTAYSPTGLPFTPPPGRTSTISSEDVSPDRAWRQRPVILTGMTAMFVVVGTVLLAGPLADSEIKERPAALPTGIIPLEPLPSPSPSLSLSFAPFVPASPSATSASASPSPRPVRRSARLEFVSGVTVLSVRTADLGDEDYRVTSPDGSPLDAATSFGDGVLRVDVKSTASGTVEVLLSSRIVWHLRLGAGVKTLDFDATSGTVSRIDLDGGAETMNLHLGKLKGVVPIRMTGGVGAWFIHTTTRVPTRVTVHQGAGNVTLYGRVNGGTGGGTVLGSRDLGDGPALDVQAVSGVGALEITRR